MAYARWYATAISLPNGQILTMGGTNASGAAVPTPEIYTPGVGWKTLTGATDSSGATYYDRAFVRSDGKVVYFGTSGATGIPVKLLDTTGNGSVTQIGTLPFAYNWESPAIQYAAGKVLVNDAGTGLWTMDINGASPVFTKVGAMAQERNYGNMTVLADGKVLINGGSPQTNVDSTAVKTAVIWDPATNTLTATPAESAPRLYHSTSVLLADGTVLSAGGGSLASPSTTLANQLNAQIYKPPYLFDANGNEAVRPKIVASPEHLKGGTSFTITVDNAADISKLMFVRSGATTHDFNMSSGAVELQFTVGANNALNVTLPDYHNGVMPGSWMLFAWNKAGVPSVAPVIEVDPVFTGAAVDGADLLVNGSLETAAEIGGGAAVTVLPGWQSTKSNFEIWKSGFNGATATDGRYLMEIDAERGTVTQAVKTEAGKSYELSFDFAGRTGFVASSKMDVLWNGKVVSTITPADTSVKHYTVTVTGTGSRDVLGFKAVDGDTDAVGGLLDNVKLKTAPGSVITISAAGSTGQESMALYIDGAQVATFDNVSKTGAVYSYQATGVVAAHQIRVGFTNDLFDAASGTDRNLTVSQVAVDGKAFHTADPSVLSTGTWTAADGVQTGYGRGDTLHSNGYFQYADASGPPTGSVISISAHGSTGQESMALLIDGLQVATFSNIPTSGGVYTFHAAGTVTAGDVRVAFTNDLYDAATGTDRNLTVSKITVDGTDFASNNPAVLSTGTWTAADGIQSGYGRGDTLHSNGYFQFADASGPPTGSVISISAAGSTGQESMALLIDGVQVATFDNIPASGGVYTFHASSTVTAGHVRVAFTNDLYDLANGIDRNLTVSKITVDGTDFASNNSAVLSTGTWTAADGIQTGYGRGDTLHSNGYFQFADAATPHVSLLTNGSFETTSTPLPDGAALYITANLVTGWTSTNTFEVWRDQGGTDGRNIVEVDAGNGTYAQMLHTTAGQTYGLAFDLAGRSGSVASSKVEVVWNGQVVTTATPTDTAFHNYHVNLIGTGHDTLEFRSVAGDTDSVGGLLDNVVLHDHAVA